MTRDLKSIGEAEVCTLTEEALMACAGRFGSKKELIETLRLIRSVFRRHYAKPIRLGKDASGEIYICPSCEVEMMKYQIGAYCLHCGQKLSPLKKS